MGKKLATQSTSQSRSKSKSKSKSGSSGLPLSKQELTKIHDLMVKSRALEERMIKIYKVGEAYFWIGGPGEEAFGVPLGMLANKGQGFDHDWLHLHYRCSPTLIAMGMDFLTPIRLIMNKATDKCTGGRNFSNHYSFPEWNVAPVTSPIGVQYSIGIGTAWAQKRRKAKGITIITGGDAGSAEGDFASGLIWASRKGSELPMLITVQNNKWGISTHYDEQHGEAHVSDRGIPFKMRTAVINGNDPIESYIRLGEEMAYIRKTGKPVVLEASVSRLFGHSSADGVNRRDELDCLEEFEKLLLKKDVLTEKKIKQIKDDYDKEAQNAQIKARAELSPEASTIWDHFYVNSESGDWRDF